MNDSIGGVGRRGGAGGGGGRMQGDHRLVCIRSGHHPTRASRQYGREGEGGGWRNGSPSTFCVSTPSSLFFLSPLLSHRLSRWPCDKASYSRAADLGLISAFAVDQVKLQVYQWLNTGTPVAILPGAW